MNERVDIVEAFDVILYILAIFVLTLLFIPGLIIFSLIMLPGDREKKEKRKKRMISHLAF